MTRVPLQCPRFLQPKSNLILGAVARGMQPAQTHVPIKLAATKALTNALEFVGPNMANKVRLLPPCEPPGTS